jgi:hypothetical protein
MCQSIINTVAENLSKSKSNINIFTVSHLWARWLESTSIKLGISINDLHRLLVITPDSAEEIVVQINGSIDLPSFLETTPLLPIILNTQDFLSYCEITHQHVSPSPNRYKLSVPYKNETDNSEIFYHGALTRGLEEGFVFTQDDETIKKKTLSRDSLVFAVSELENLVSINWDYFNKEPVNIISYPVFLEIKKPYVISKAIPFIKSKSNVSLGSILSTVVTYFEKSLDLGELLNKKLEGAFTQLDAFNVIKSFEDDHKLQGLVVKLLKASGYDSFVNKAEGGLWDETDVNHGITVFSSSQIMSALVDQQRNIEWPDKKIPYSNSLYNSPPPYTAVLYQLEGVHPLIEYSSLLNVAKTAARKGTLAERIKEVTSWKKNIKDKWTSDLCDIPVMINKVTMNYIKGAYTYSGSLKGLLVPNTHLSLYNSLGNVHVQIKIAQGKRSTVSHPDISNCIHHLTIVCPTFKKAHENLNEFVKIFINKIEKGEKSESPQVKAFYRKQYNDLSLILHTAENQNITIQESETIHKHKISKDISMLVSSSSQVQIQEYFYKIKEKIRKNSGNNLLIDCNNELNLVDLNFNIEHSSLKEIIKYPSLFHLYSICSCRSVGKIEIQQASKVFLSYFMFLACDDLTYPSLRKTYSEICESLNLLHTAMLNDNELEKWSIQCREHVFNGGNKPFGFDLFSKSINLIVSDLRGIGVYSEEWLITLENKVKKHSLSIEDIDLSELNINFSQNKN